MAKDAAVSPRRAKTRARLIEAAGQIIAEKGFQGATLDEIAARAGLTKGAIYDNFESKDELFFAVVGANPSRLPLPEDRHGTVAERLARMAEAALDDGPDARLHVPLRAEFLLYVLKHEEMRQRVEPWLKAGFAAERDQLLKAFEPSELPMSPEAFVVLLQAMVPGLAFLRSQSPGLVSDEVVREIFQAFAPKA